MENEIKVIDKNGIEKKYDILSTFDYKSRKFIIYTDYSYDESNNIKVYSGIFKDEKTISPVKDKDDETVVNDFIKYLEEGLKSDTLFD